MMTLKQASTKQWVKQAEKKLQKFSQGLRVINEQLWCCSSKASIVVFDSDLQKQRVIRTADMGRVCDVAETTNGDIIIASTNGLYCTGNGECSQLTSTTGEIHQESLSLKVNGKTNTASTSPN